MNQIRWNIAASAETDKSLRLYLASQGCGRKEDLARFIEEAVRAHILELTAKHVKSANIEVSEKELTAIVDEAVQWASNLRSIKALDHSASRTRGQIFVNRCIRHWVPAKNCGNDSD